MSDSDANVLALGNRQRERQWLAWTRLAQGTGALGTAKTTGRTAGDTQSTVLVRRFLELAERGHIEREAVARKIAPIRG
jgi:hypothetical protein